jgi:oryzin
MSQSGATYGLERISHRNQNSITYVYDPSAGSGTTVYVVDTGIYTSHSQFSGRASLGANYISDSPVSDLLHCSNVCGTFCITWADNLKNRDENGYDTHCSGAITGSTYGVAKKANLAVKVLDKNGSGSNSGVISGIQ